MPDSRIRRANERAVRRDGRWVLYWMIAARRVRANFALQRAVELAEELERPLLVLEALECDYPWASDRLHRFVLDGMRDQREALAAGPVRYFPYVEPEPGAGAGLLESLAGEACAVVTDDSPAFFIPRIIRAAAERVPVSLEAIDSNGLLPLRAADRVFKTAHSFRRFLQRELPAHLEAQPRPDPLRGAAFPRCPEPPDGVLMRWRPASDALLAAEPAALSDIAIDHSIAPVELVGGPAAAVERLNAFVGHHLERYEQRNHPDEEAASGLSPYLHFGHVSTHEVFAAIAEGEGWALDRLGADSSGRRSGWWGMSAPAEAFLDELVTWRELGYNGAAHDPGFDRYESLPEWSRATLEAHAADPREHVYGLEEFAEAETHDPIWNAAQRQLLRDGVIHNYLRMLWGKKILEWTASPREALDVMVELNNRYALDGRDPNSYSGIHWVLGRYDRAWGPERPVFGKVRYMSSERTRRKLRMAHYLDRYGV